MGDLPEEKVKAIKKVYHDKIVGYGSVTSTYKKIKSRPIYEDLNITLNDVKTYIDNLPQKQVLFNYKGYNSFVSHAFLDQFHMDIADFTKHAEANDGYRYCLVAVDVFSRYADAVPIKGKDIANVLPAFEKIIDVIGKPKSIFTDQEGSMNSTEWKQFVK